ncbi:P-loop containing nucleoside triphosphate hydrolase protein [Triangularia setosa]|uniref:P-loop containing nucleoside triphosphate hydrolase protein n=1 Tax=Triangularia setosa TaxID=2587417 RepID=A0AAN7A2Z2_9PEZI|nr:P-loop containing nucleoside triphosphate hydrolase protein [Podospora setosa]
MATSQRKMLIQMSGAPGAGKSTMAKLLQRSIGGLVIDHDVIRSAILENNVPFELAAKQAYNLQWVFTREVVRQGLSVIIDSPCNFREAIDQGQKIAADHDLVYWYVECKVDDIDLLDRRLRTRPPMKSQRTAVDQPPEAARMMTPTTEEQKAQFIRWMKTPCRPQQNVIIVDTSGDLENTKNDILAQILSAE